jgi:hypothetical protein
MAQTTASRRLIAGGALAIGLALGGCVNFTAVDDLKTAAPTGTPFARALFADYSFLARSFGDIGHAGYTTFDQADSISLNRTDRDVAGLANSFASKALALARGEDVDPEPGTTNAAHALRDRLVRALGPGTDSYPRDAARAQADYDCWMLNAAVPSQASAADQCARSLNTTLARLESEVQSIAKTPEAPAAPAAAPADAPESSDQ